MRNFSSPAWSLSLVLVATIYVIRSVDIIACSMLLLVTIYLKSDRAKYSVSQKRPPPQILRPRPHISVDGVSGQWPHSRSVELNALLVKWKTNKKRFQWHNQCATLHVTINLFKHYVCLPSAVVVCLHFYPNVTTLRSGLCCRNSVCLSVVCNVGAPYSGSWTFRQNFFTAVYAGHPLTSVQNFTEVVPGEPLRRAR